MKPNTNQIFAPREKNGFPRDSGPKPAQDDLAAADPIGNFAEETYAIGSLVTALSSFAAFYFMTPGVGKVTLWLAIIVPFGVLYASVYGPEAALFCELSLRSSASKMGTRRPRDRLPRVR